MGVFDRKPYRQPPIDLAAIIADNIVPIAGVFLLGWNAVSLVVLYFAGFLLDIAVCVAILMTLEADRREFLGDMPDTPINRVKVTLGVGLALVVLLGTFALVFGWPMFVVFAQASGPSVGAVFSDQGFLTALALHVLLTARAGLHTGRELAGHKREDPKFDVVRVMRRQFAFVTSRWLAVYVASFFLPLPEVLVVAYCAASVYYAIKRPESL